MTVANRSPAPTVQNLPDNRASMSLISRSATPPLRSVDSGLDDSDTVRNVFVIWGLAGMISGSGYAPPLGFVLLLLGVAQFVSGCNELRPQRRRRGYFM